MFFELGACQARQHGHGHLLDGQLLTHSLDHMITVDDHVTSHILYS